MGETVPPAGGGDKGQGGTSTLALFSGQLPSTASAERARPPAPVAGPASAAEVPTGSGSGSGAEARSPDSTRRPVGIATVTASELGTAVVAGSELVPSPRSTESIPDTLLEVLKDL